MTAVAVAPPGEAEGGDDFSDEQRVYEMPWSVYGAYVKTAYAPLPLTVDCLLSLTYACVCRVSSGGVCVTLAILFFMCLNTAANITTNRYLAFWADESDPGLRQTPAVLSCLFQFR